MSGSLNKVVLIGNLGADPEIRNTQSGDKVANLSIATTESWKDASGTRQSKTEWHRVVVFGGLAGVCDNYLKKGSKIYIEGKLQTRKWTDNNGQDKYTTEIVVNGFGGNMIMLDNNNGSNGFGGDNSNTSQSSSSSNPFNNSIDDDFSDLDDDIPF